MIPTLIAMAAVGALAAVFATWHARVHRPPPTAVPSAPPGQLDRSDFRAPDAPLLIAVFTSATCSSCEAVWAELSGYESASVATQNIEIGAEPELHRRYAIDAVPTAVIVDAVGTTQAAFVGPLAADHRRVLRDLVADAAES